jgi:general stress protein YciG
MDKETQRAIAVMGGRAAQAAGTAHQYTPAEARAAGSKGGKKIAEDHAHMVALGKLGGRRSAAKRAAAAAASKGKVPVPGPQGPQRPEAAEGSAADTRAASSPSRFLDQGVSR